jgi:hypothetical protein
MALAASSMVRMPSRYDGHGEGIAESTNEADPGPSEGAVFDQPGYRE